MASSLERLKEDYGAYTPGKAKLSPQRSRVPTTYNDVTLDEQNMSQLLGGLNDQSVAKLNQVDIKREVPLKWIKKNGILDFGSQQQLRESQEKQKNKNQIYGYPTPPSNKSRYYNHDELRFDNL